MKKLLHIVATPRGEESRTLQISGVFLKSFKEKNKDWSVDELELSKEKLPALTLKRAAGKYVLLSGKDLDGELKEAWKEIVTHIDRFLSADGYLISAPMWNFSIPYMLKHYIDVIMQPKYLFRYTATGAEGLVKGKKMIVITSRGGDYSSGAARGLDLQEPYIKNIFGLAGINDIKFINAQPMDMGPDLQRERIAQAIKIAQDYAEKF